MISFISATLPFTELRTLNSEFGDLLPLQRYLFFTILYLFELSNKMFLYIFSCTLKFVKLKFCR